MKTMSSEGNLEVEEFEHVPLVRMEDVQPARACERVVDDDEISVGSEFSQESQSEAIETFVVDGSEIDCVVDDGDSNIGSMVSINTDYVEEPELIVPEVLETDLIQKPQSPTRTQPSVPVMKNSTTGSWPTLEILPGGVINLSDKALFQSNAKKKSSNENSLMYACAKCSERFNYLFCLVKHVRLHEDEERQNKNIKLLKPPSPPLIGKKNRTIKKMEALEKRSTEIDQEFGEVIIRGKQAQPTKNKKHKLSVSNEKYICLEGGTIKLLNKPKRTKAPKKKS